jgi:hypothetical protein
MRQEAMHWCLAVIEVLGYAYQSFGVCVVLRHVKRSLEHCRGRYFCIDSENIPCGREEACNAVRGSSALRL